MIKSTSHISLSVFFAGITDGVIVPLTVYAFFIKICKQNSEALAITAIGGLALAVMLAIGAYLTRKTEIENNEENKLLKIYSGLDISQPILQEMTQDTIRETENWQKVWEESDNVNGNFSPVNYALIIGFGYFSGLFIVLINGYFIQTEGLKFLILPLLFLAVLGFIKSKVAGLNPVVGMLAIVISGAAAALGNWLIAGLF